MKPQTTTPRRPARNADGTFRAAVPEKFFQNSPIQPLTSSPDGVIFVTLDVEVRCHKRQLATVMAANSRNCFAVSLYYLSLSGALRRGVTCDTSSTPAGSLFVPAVEGRGESGKSSITRRSECCTTTTPPRNSAGSKPGSNSHYSRQRDGNYAAAANLQNIRIQPDHPRKHSKQTRCAKQSRTLFFRFGCSTNNRGNFPLMTHCA